MKRTQTKLAGWLDTRLRDLNARGPDATRTQVAVEWVKSLDSRRGARATVPRSEYLWADYQAVGVLYGLPAGVMWVVYQTEHAFEVIRRCRGAIKAQPRKAFYAGAALFALYLATLYVAHQAHPCYVAHGYALIYQTSDGAVELCSKRAWWLP